LSTETTGGSPDRWRGGRAQPGGPQLARAAAESPAFAPAEEQSAGGQIVGGLPGRPDACTAPSGWYDWWYDWSVASAYAKVSVSLPVGLLERTRDRVGSRGLSRYVAQAMEAQERRDALRDWLAGQDAEHGSIPEEIMQEVRKQWLGDADG